MCYTIDTCESLSNEFSQSPVINLFAQIFFEKKARASSPSSQMIIAEKLNHGVIAHEGQVFIKKSQRCSAQSDQMNGIYRMASKRSHGTLKKSSQTDPAKAKKPLNPPSYSLEVRSLRIFL
jgi:hypothetical protein